MPVVVVVVEPVGAVVVVVVVEPVDDDPLMTMSLVVGSVDVVDVVEDVVVVDVGSVVVVDVVEDVVVADVGSVVVVDVVEDVVVVDVGSVVVVDVVVVDAGAFVVIEPSADGCVPVDVFGCGSGAVGTGGGAYCSSRSNWRSRSLSNTVAPNS